MKFLKFLSISWFLVWFAFFLCSGAEINISEWSIEMRSTMCGLFIVDMVVIAIMCYDKPLKS